MEETQKLCLAIRNESNVTLISPRRKVGRVQANEYDQQRLLDILPDGARRLLRAIAHEGVVKAPQAGDFIRRHALRAASSVKTSLEMLMNKELVYQSERGYIVYDRFLGEYLRRYE